MTVKKAFDLVETTSRSCVGMFVDWGVHDILGIFFFFFDEIKRLNPYLYFFIGDSSGSSSFSSNQIDVSVKWNDMV